MIKKTAHLLIILSLCYLSLIEFGFAQDFMTQNNQAVNANLAGVSNTTSNNAAGAGLNTISPPAAPTAQQLLTTANCKNTCGPKKATEGESGFNACVKSCEGGSAPSGNKPADPGDQTVMGITMGPNCLKNGQCGFSIYNLLGINRSSSPTLFVQDILLSATFFIGTVITLALIYSGIMFIMAGATGKDPTSAKSGMKNAIIGLLIVICSYSIIRLVQYIAKGF